MSYYSILLAGILAWGFLLVPPILYIHYRLDDKYKYLESFFTEDNLKLYYKLFKRTVPVAQTLDLKELFGKHYRDSYGTINFVVPLIIFGLILGLGDCVIVRTLIQDIDKNIQCSPVPQMAMSAFFGAYLWVGFDLGRRLRNQDFTYHDVHRWSLRFLIAVPTAYAFSFAVKEPIGLPLAFFLGSFPVSTLMKYSRRLAGRYLKIGDEGENDTSELERLQGVGRVEAERFREEGISNILALAYSDPVDVTMRTTYDLNYVQDLKSQALLWIYLGDDLSKLKGLGLRGAHEAQVLQAMLRHENPDHVEVGEASIKEICKRLGVDEKSFRKTLMEIAGDPHTKFLGEIW